MHRFSSAQTGKTLMSAAHPRSCRAYATVAILNRGTEAFGTLAEIMKNVSQQRTMKSNWPASISPRRRGVRGYLEPDAEVVSRRRSDSGFDRQGGKNWGVADAAGVSMSI